MEIKIEEKNNLIKVQLEGRLVASCSEKLKEELEPKIANCPNVIFDLSKMTHIDSSGLGALVMILQKTRAAGGITRLACLQPHPRIVFDITKVFRVFEIFDTVEAAEKAFQA